MRSVSVRSRAFTDVVVFEYFYHKNDRFDHENSDVP